MLALEAELLQGALRRLRQQGDARGALSELDRYRTRYPGGSLSDEERAARVEALLALGDRVVALAILDELEAAGRLNHSSRLRLTRAELLAQAGRCQEALKELAPFADAPGGALRERALYCRASCWSQLGDDAASRRDLERYLLLYPSGRFAEPARQVLEKVEPE